MILVLKGIFSHADKYGKLWFNFVVSDDMNTNDDSQAKLKRHCDGKHVPYTTNYFIVTVSNALKKFPIDANTYSTATLIVRVNLKKYSYVANGIKIEGSKLMLIDISKLSK